jgi:hypothetical protein
MQCSNRLVIAGVFALATVFGESALAQLTGGRGVPFAPPITPMQNTGAPINPAAGAGTTVTAAQPTLGINRQPQGMERFLRQSRSPRDFVGRSRADITTFIGAQQALATGQVRSATEGLRPDPSSAKRVNRPIPAQPAKGLYYPKLELDLSESDDSGDDDRDSNQLSRPVEPKLFDRVHRIGGPDVQISLKGNSAVLSGSVNSKRDSELVEQVVSFEPGIDRVVNQLTIAR